MTFATAIDLMEAATPEPPKPERDHLYDLTGLNDFRLIEVSLIPADQVVYPGAVFKR